MDDDDVTRAHLISEDGVTDITMGTVPDRRPFLPAGCDGELPLDYGHMKLPFPPDSGEVVAPVIKNGDIIGYYRVKVEQREPKEAEDFWAYQDDWIPGEYEFELRIGDSPPIRDMADFAVKLANVSPAQYARLALVFAGVALDQTDPAILN